MLGAAERAMTSQQPEGARSLLPTKTGDRFSSAIPEASVPVHVRAIGVELTEDDHNYIHRKLLAKLGKFATSIHRISVRVTDLNGPRGGVDQVCTVKVVLSGLPSVVVTRRDAAINAAIDAALHAIEQAVQGIVGRRRMRPLRNPITRADTGRL
jgi:ribosome-associated translation inhibitor RaiA